MEGGERRPPAPGDRALHHQISAPAAAQRAAGDWQGGEHAGLPHAKSANARLERGVSLTPSEAGSDKQTISGGTKARKPYVLQKQRERWTDAEHALFLEALREHGRAWRRIEEHIGTKTAVQIRSHAQKFFAKLEREQASGHKSLDLPPDLTIPPPRPKRKPARPYPKKSDINTGGSTATAAHLGNSVPSAGAGGRHVPSPSPGPSLRTGSVNSAGGIPPWAVPLPPGALHIGGSKAAVAAVAAAAASAAAAAAAAVVATADEATQAQLQADPPQGFPFFGMQPSALAQYAAQMQASPQVQGYAAATQAMRAMSAPLQFGHPQWPSMPHSAGLAGPAARRMVDHHQYQQAHLLRRNGEASAMEWTATNDPNAQFAPHQQMPAHPMRSDSDGDGDSACSRETSGHRSDKGASAAKAAAAVTAAANALQMVRAASASAAVGHASTGRGATADGRAAAAAAAAAANGADNMRAASSPQMWAHLPIAALLQAAAVSSGAVLEPNQLPADTPMAHAHLFKPPFKAAAANTSQRRAERAGKLRARRGGPSPVAAVPTATISGGTNPDASTPNGSSGEEGSDDKNNNQQSEEAIGAPRKSSSSGTGAAAKQDNDASKPASGGDVGSNDSQDSLLVKGAKDDSGAAEGYGSNPTGNGSSDGTNGGNGNGSSDNDVVKDVSKGNGQSKAPEGLIPEPEPHAGKAHAHAHAQAHPHAGQLAAMQSCKAGARAAPASANGNGWSDTSQGVGQSNGLGQQQSNGAAGPSAGRAKSDGSGDGSDQGRSSATFPTAAGRSTAGSAFGGYGPPGTMDAQAAQAAAAASALQQAGVNPYLLSAAAAACGEATDRSVTPTNGNPAAAAGIPGSTPGAAPWAAGLQGLAAAGSVNPSLGLNQTGLPGPMAQTELRAMFAPLFGAGGAANATALQQHQALLQQLQQPPAQRHPSVNYQHPIEGPHPLPGQGKPHSAFEPVAKLPPTAAAKGSPRNGAQANGTPSPRAAMAGGGEACQAPEQPSRPKASRASPVDSINLPPAHKEANGGPTVAVKEGSGSGSGVSNASGFQPYRADSAKRSLSGPRLDVPPRKRFQSLTDLPHV